MVLEGYLYVRVSLCSLCAFNIFGVRAVFSIDACRLFPQCVLVITPLIGGVQMWWLVPGPGVCGNGSSSGAPQSTWWEWKQLATTPEVQVGDGRGSQPLPSVREGGSGGSWTLWEGGGEGSWPFLGSEREVAGAHDYSWVLGGMLRGLMTTPGVWKGCSSSSRLLLVSGRVGVFWKF